MSELEKKIDWIIRVLTYRLKREEDYHYNEDISMQRHRLLNQAPEVDYHMIEEKRPLED